MTARRTRVEDVVIAAVRAALPYLRGVHAYAGELGGKDLDEVKNRLRGQAPAVLVATSDSRQNLDIQARRMVKDVDVELHLVSGNMRSRESKLRTPEDGIYQMADDIEKLLLGRESGLDDTGRFGFVSERKVVHEPDLAIWTVTYRVPFFSRGTDPVRPSILELAGKLYQSRDEDPAGTDPPVAEVVTELLS